MESSVLEIKNLCFRYPDNTLALEDVNFKVKTGEFIGILGANGSGKTTLLKILNGLLKPSEGEILLDGEPVSSIKKNMLFTKICTMFQNPDHQLFCSTAKEDVAFGPTNMGLSKQEVQDRTRYALDAVNMSDLADRAIHCLSHGQKKRICLAGVLAITPRIILLDEPTSSLDPRGVESIMTLLRDLNRKKDITMVMATHAVDLVPLFIDRVIVLDKGKVVAEGLPDFVFLNSEMIWDAKLRLPWIGLLFEMLKKKDGLDIAFLPLTVGEARRELKKLFAPDKPNTIISKSETNL